VAVDAVRAIAAPSRLANARPAAYLT